MVSHNIVKVVCKDPKAISHAILELAIVDSLHTALHSVELTASAVELIFEPLTLVAELPGATWWQLVYDSSLAVLHISMKVANILVAVAHELFAVAVALAVDPGSLVVHLIRESEAPNAVVLVGVRVEITHIV